jgi:hypothetical protein
MRMRMQPLSERTRLSFPRYRVEERTPDMAAIIVGFADTPLHSETLLARRAAQLIRARVWAELVVIDQDTDTVVLRRDIWVTRKS